MNLNDIPTDSNELSVDLGGLSITSDESGVDLNAPSVDTVGITIASEESVVDSSTPPVDTVGITIASEESVVDSSTPPVDTVQSPINSTNTETGLNRLNALPEHLFSMICDSMDWSSRPDRKGLLSLRRTCRDSDEKSDFTMSRVLRLRLTKFSLEARSLSLLLSLSSKPRYAKLMQSIRIVSDDPSIRSRYAQHMPLRSVQSTPIQEYEDEYSFVKTGEAALILAQCFRNLQGTSSLRWLAYDEGTSNLMGLTTILRALQLSQFPRKVVDIIFHDHTRDAAWGSLAGLTEFRPYIMRVQIHCPRHLPDYCERKWEPEERKYRLGMQPLQVADVARDVNILHIATVPNPQRRRFLQWREVDEFLYSLYITEPHYPHLVELHLGSLVYMSGSQLCKFLSKHSATLSTFHASTVALIDMSWTDVFTELKKLPLIQHVGFRLLYQKKAAKEGRPNPYSKIPPNYGITICSDQAKSLLDKLITYFDVCSNTWSVSYMTPYWEVQLFHDPNLSTLFRKYPNMSWYHPPFGVGPFPCSRKRWISS